MFTDYYYYNYYYNAQFKSVRHFKTDGKKCGLHITLNANDILHNEISHPNFQTNYSFQFLVIDVVTYVLALNHYLSKSC